MRPHQLRERNREGLSGSHARKKERLLAPEGRKTER